MVPRSVSSLSGAVLVGGASRRMGQDKAGLVLDGRPLAGRVATALRAAGVAPIASIGGPGPHDEHRTAGAAAPSTPAAPTTPDDDFDEHHDDRWPGEGPLGGLLTALRWSPTRWVVVVACDLGWLTAEALLEIIAVDPGEAHAVFARTDRIEPLCARWDVARAAPALQRAFDAGERSIRRAIGELSIRGVEVTDRSVWRDLDTPQDVERWRSERAAGSATT